MARFLSCWALAVCLAIGTSAAAQEAEFDPAAPETVMAVQEELTGFGYNPGVADGKMGGKTSTAIEAFQKATGLMPTGEITPALMAQFEAEHRRAARAGDVKQLFTALKTGDGAATAKALERVGDLGDLRENDSFSKALRRAVSTGNMVMAQALLDRGFGPDGNKWKPGLMHLALDRPDAEMTRLVASHMTDLEPLDEHGMTPLVKALYNKNAEAAMVLIDAGADIHTRRFRDVTPLHFAANAGLTGVVDRLLVDGADATIRDGVIGLTPVEAAIKSRQWEAMDRLLQSGPPPSEDSEIFQAMLEVEGEFGQSGLIERADRLVVRETSFAGGAVTRSMLVVTAPEGQRYQIAVPSETNANSGGVVVSPGSEGRTSGVGSHQARINLGEPGSIVPASGVIGANADGNEDGATKITGLVVGPEGTFKGSYVIGEGGLYPASSTEKFEALGIPRDQVPEGAALFQIDDKVKLKLVE